ncbi:MAG TPA: PAS domain-containing protein, partial [Methylotenera sp.]|nr:PAS domain-containing protein [Methylotenera sp.]
MLQKSRSLLFNTVTPQKGDQNWRSLHFLNSYRVVLAGVFVTSIFFEKNLPLLGSHDPISYVFVSYLYIGLGIFASFAIHWRWAKFENFVVALTLVDITCLTTIMHTSGGIETGLGMLIVVAIAANSMLTNGQYAKLIAAMAAIAILAEQVVAGFDYRVQTNYSHAGFLGAALFATAMLSYVLSRRLTETEALAEQRGIDLANMAQLNEHVIKRLYSGVIVVDDENRIRLINQSACQLIGMPFVDKIEGKHITILSDELSQQLQVWKENNFVEAQAFKPVGSSTEILPNFTRLSTRDSAPVLIFLEDVSRMNHQAQQM